jgi:molybdopterin/thiamine biosynthesis adenylyltransferase/rhodanese-related sulfurtransferase
MEELSEREEERYARQIRLPELGAEGQLRLKSSSALVIGAGGLGSPVSIYLAAAGVGRIGLVDFDNVDITNLHRQILYGASDVGLPKLDRAAARLGDLNPEVAIEKHEARLTSENAMQILASYDVVIDGTDNFATRYLVNDATVMLGKPNVYGSIFRFEGQLSVFDARKGPCYRCLYPDPPPPDLVPSCAVGGVLGVLPGVIGTLQAIEAIKLLAGIGEPLIGRLLLFDALSTRFRQLTLQKDARCRVCGPDATVTSLIDYDEFCAGPPKLPDEYDAPALAKRLRTEPGLRLIDVRETYEWKAGHIGVAEHIPMAELPARVGELRRDEEIVVYCRSGARSAKALEWLRKAGFSRVRHLRGGAADWARVIDPTMRVV